MQALGITKKQRIGWFYSLKTPEKNYFLRKKQAAVTAGRVIRQHFLEDRPTKSILSTPT